MKTNNSSAYLPCILPWKALFMDERQGELSALPCCANWINKSYGPIPDTEDSLQKVWNSPGAREIRRLLIEGQHSELCAEDCPWYVSGKFGEEQLRILPGPGAFMENQRKNNKEIRQRKIRLESWPMLIRVIPTLQCNLQCRMCLQDKKIDLEIPEVFFADLRTAGKYIYDYQLHGGEVLLSPDFPDWADPDWFAANPQMQLSLVTNGTCIPERVWKVFTAIKINYITVSLNAASPETYKYITGKNLFNMVIDNVISLQKLAESHRIKSFVVNLSFVITRSNYRELPAFVKLAKQLGTPIRMILVVGNRGNESIYSKREIVVDVLKYIEAAEVHCRPEDRLELNRVKESLQSTLELWSVDKMEGFHNGT